MSVSTSILDIPAFYNKNDVYVYGRNYTRVVTGFWRWSIQATRSRGFSAYTLNPQLSQSSSEKKGCRRADVEWISLYGDTDRLALLPESRALVVRPKLPL